MFEGCSEPLLYFRLIRVDLKNAKTDHMSRRASSVFAVPGPLKLVLFTSYLKVKTIRMAHGHTHDPAVLDTN